MIVAGLVPGNEAINAALLASHGAGMVARPRDVGALVGRDPPPAARRLDGPDGPRRSCPGAPPTASWPSHLAGEAEADAA